MTGSAHTNCIIDAHPLRNLASTRFGMGDWDWEPAEEFSPHTIWDGGLGLGRGRDVLWEHGSGKMGMGMAGMNTEE